MYIFGEGCKKWKVFLMQNLVESLNLRLITNNNHVLQPIEGQCLLADLTSPLSADRGGRHHLASSRQVLSFCWLSRQSYRCLNSLSCWVGTNPIHWLKIVLHLGMNQRHISYYEFKAGYHRAGMNIKRY